LSSAKPTILSASIHDRLLNIAKSNQENFTLTLNRYAIERFLYRLSSSSYQEEFVLKGATLFVLWTGQLHRPTRDLDLLGFGSTDIPRLVTLFQSICEQIVEEDGIEFISDSVSGMNVREEDDYDGVRIKLHGMIGRIQIPLQIDIGFGDVVIPRLAEVDLPTMLNQSSPRIKAYPRESVIAEKFEAMVDLGMTNSRMKDFYDIWFLVKSFGFEGEILAQAIAATFERRRTPIPMHKPLALTEEFYNDVKKQTQWRAFLKKSSLERLNPPDLISVVGIIDQFLLPLISSIQNGTSFDRHWSCVNREWQQDPPE
jgi:predicted nucleotidyltransferase component of viral defense system